MSDKRDSPTPPDDERDEELEAAYLDGRRAACLDILQHVMRNLDDGKSEAKLRVELEDVRREVAALYELVVEQPFPGEFYLPDVVVTIRRVLER